MLVDEAVEHQMIDVAAWRYVRPLGLLADPRSGGSQAAAVSS